MDKYYHKKTPTNIKLTVEKLDGFTSKSDIKMPDIPAVSGLLEGPSQSKLKIRDLNITEEDITLSLLLVDYLPKNRIS